MTEIDAALAIDSGQGQGQQQLEHVFEAKSGWHDQDRVTTVQCRHKLFMNYGPSVQECKWVHFFVCVTYVYVYMYVSCLYITHSYRVATSRSHILKGNIRYRLCIMSDGGDLFTTHENPRDDYQVFLLRQRLIPEYMATQVFLHV